MSGNDKGKGLGKPPQSDTGSKPVPGKLNADLLKKFSATEPVRPVNKFTPPSSSTKFTPPPSSTATSVKSTTPIHRTAATSHKPVAASTQTVPGRLKKDQLTPFSSDDAARITTPREPVKQKEQDKSAVRFTASTAANTKSAVSNPVHAAESETITKSKVTKETFFDIDLSDDIDPELGNRVVILKTEIPLPTITDAIPVQPKTKKTIKQAAMDRYKTLKDDAVTKFDANKDKLPSRRTALLIMFGIIGSAIALYFIVHRDEPAISNAPGKSDGPDFKPPDPTFSPTPGATFVPTSVPSAAQTAQPTAAQTAKPTARPTTRPTAQTAQPTAQQTAAPTPSTPTGSYPIEILFQGGQPDAVIQGYVAAAKARIEKVVKETSVSPFVFKNTMVCSGYQGDGRTINGILILANINPIDGPNGVLGSAGPCLATTETISGVKMSFARAGMMTLDSEDILRLSPQTAINVITHEMLHVFGIGTLGLWRNNIYTDELSRPRLRGGQLLKDANAAVGSSGDPFIENNGGSGTAGGHFEETISKHASEDFYSGYGSELMTGYTSSGAAPLSILTAEALRFLGYKIDPKGVEVFVIKPPTTGRRLRGEKLEEKLIFLEADQIYPAEPTNETDSSPKRRR